MLALFGVVLVTCSAFAGGVAGAQEDPFVTSGPDQLGERVSESDQATARLNQAVYGLLGLAGLIAVGTVVFWRMSAPTVERVRRVQPAFHIEYKPPVGGSSGPPVGPSVEPRTTPPPFAVPTVATITVDPDTSDGAWASQGWGLEDSA